MIERDDILQLIPHQGGMCLLDRVLSWDEANIHCQSRAHVRADMPLRSNGRLRGAQRQAAAATEHVDRPDGRQIGTGGGDELRRTAQEALPPSRKALLLPGSSVLDT